MTMRASLPSPSTTNQRGVAIISALLVVALSAILVSGMLWRQEVQIRRIENQRLLAQANWISRSALDWTRLILRSEADTSPTVTYLGGVWGVPIAKTRLSDFLGQIGEVRAEQGAQTYLSGSIEDAQAKFNLRNLVSTPTPGVLTINVEQIASFQRLLALLGLNGSLAKTTALQIRAGLAQSATRFQTAIDDDGLDAAIGHDPDCAGRRHRRRQLHRRSRPEGRRQQRAGRAAAGDHRRFAARRARLHAGSGRARCARSSPCCRRRRPST